MFDNKKVLLAGSSLGKPMEVALMRFITNTGTAYNYGFGQQFLLEVEKGTGPFKAQWKLAGQPDSAFTDIFSGGQTSRYFDDRDFALNKQNANNTSYQNAMTSYQAVYGPWGDGATAERVDLNLESFFSSTPTFKNIVFRFFGSFKTIKFGGYGGASDLSSPLDISKTNPNILAIKSYGDCQPENLQFINSTIIKIPTDKTVDTFYSNGANLKYVRTFGYATQAAGSAGDAQVDKSLILPMPKKFKNMDRMFFMFSDSLSNLSGLDTTAVTSMRETFAGSYFLNSVNADSASSCLVTSFATSSALYKTTAVIDMSGCFKALPPVYNAGSLVPTSQVANLAVFKLSALKKLDYAFAYNAYQANHPNSSFMYSGSQNFTASIESMEGMFYKTLWNGNSYLYMDSVTFSNCKSLKDMFYGAKYYTTPPSASYSNIRFGYYSGSYFSGSNYTRSYWPALDTMEGMLDSCLVYCDVNPINAPAVKSVKRLFAMTEYKETLIGDVPRFSQLMPLGNRNPFTIGAGVTDKGFSFASVTDMSEMYKFNKWAFPTGQSWSTANVQTMESMFEEARIWNNNFADDPLFYQETTIPFPYNHGIDANNPWTNTYFNAPIPQVALKNIKAMFKNCFDTGASNYESYFKTSFFNRSDQYSFYPSQEVTPVISALHNIDSIEDASYAFFIDRNRFINIFLKPVILNNYFYDNLLVTRRDLLDKLTWKKLKYADFMFAYNDGVTLPTEPLKFVDPGAQINFFFATAVVFDGAELISGKGMFMGRTFNTYGGPVFKSTAKLVATDYMFANCNLGTPDFGSVNDQSYTIYPSWPALPTYTNIKPVTATYMFYKATLGSKYGDGSNNAARLNLSIATDISHIFDQAGMGWYGIPEVANGIQLATCKADYAFYKCVSLMITYQPGTTNKPGYGIVNEHANIRKFFGGTNTCLASSMDHAFDGVTDIYNSFFFPAGYQFPNLKSANYAFANMGAKVALGTPTPLVFNFGNMSFPELIDAEGMAFNFTSLGSIAGMTAPKLKNAKKMFSIETTPAPYVTFNEFPDAAFFVPIENAEAMFRGVLVAGVPPGTDLPSSLSNKIAAIRWTNVKTLKNCFASTNFTGNVSAWTFPVCETFEGIFSGMPNAVSFLASSRNWVLPATCKSLSRMFQTSYFVPAGWNSADSVAINTAACTELDLSFMFEGTNFDANITMNMTPVTSIENMFASTPFNKAVNHFTFTKLKSIRGVFSSAASFNQPVNYWNVSTVTNMSYAFAGTTAFGQSLVGWDVRNVTDMSYMFLSGGPIRNIAGINAFNTANVTNFQGMFMNAYYVDMDLLFPTWNMGKAVTTMDMFNGAYLGNNSVWPASWNSMPNLVTMQGMFAGLRATPGQEPLLNLSSCNFPLLQNMDYTFSGTQPRFNLWSTANPNLTSIMGLFLGTNIDKIAGINAFKVNNVVNMSKTFQNATAATNSTLDFSSWNTGNVTNMDYLFYGINFTQVSTFYGRNTSKVTSMRYTFSSNVTAYSLNASAFDTSKVVDFEGCFMDIKAGTDIQYLEYWSMSSAKSLKLMFAYTTSGTANPPIGGWNVSTVENFSGMFKNNTGAAANLANWNTISALDMSQMFFNATGFKNISIATWNVSKCKDFSYMFYGCDGWTSMLTNWDISNAETLEGIFSRPYGTAGGYVPIIIPWGPKMTKVKSLKAMYQNNTNITNMDLSGWKVNAVIDFSYMFCDANNFAGSVLNWQTYAAVYMNDMFRATKFNGPVNHFYMYYVTDCTRMFWAATLFNKPLNSWNTSNVKSMNTMFANTSFNSALFTNVGSLEDANSMFANNTAFNQIAYLANWRPAKLLTANSMFLGCTGLSMSGATSNVSAWVMPLLKDATYMFQGCNKFNSPVTSWNMSSLENASGLFYGCTSFNQPIPWQANTTKLNIAWRMFSDCPAFNQPLANLVVNQVTNSDWFLSNCTAFNNTWPKKWNKLTSAYGMFNGTSKFAQSLVSMCVPLIGSTPGSFNASSAITALPVWGTCPA